MTRTNWTWVLALCVLLGGCSDSNKGNKASGDQDAAMDGDDGGAVNGGSGSSGKTGQSGGSGTSGKSGGAGGTSGGGSGTGSQTGDAAVGTAMDAGPIVVPEALQLCGGPCACADGVDNDMDGVVDGFDSECTGPGDNDEGSFATGIPGDNMDPKWQDCFFDGNSGGGDDGCRYSTKCLTGELSQDDKDCAQSQDCIDFCRPRAPNGCDCFGCCEVYKPDGTSVHIILNASCDENDLDACQTCTPSADCNNDCGECELCAGKTVADLPASCGSMTGSGGTGDGGNGGNGGNGGDGAGGNGAGGNGSGGSGEDTGYRCNDNEALCANNADCDSSHYCTFGCCVLAGPD